MQDKPQTSVNSLDLKRQTEAQLKAAGYEYVAGVDEAGIGPLAGPVVAAAVILPDGFELKGVDDSKKLTARRRELLFDPICQQAISWSIIAVDVTEIDEMNIYHAGLEAMRRAVMGLQPPADCALVDGRVIPGISIPQERIVGGDAKEVAIAAASVLAKVHRDRCMAELDRIFPGYGFAKHKGYPTAQHQDALLRLGPCAAHRSSFPAVQAFSGALSAAYTELANALLDVQDETGLEGWRREVHKREFPHVEKKRLLALAQRKRAKWTIEKSPISVQQGNLFEES